MTETPDSRVVSLEDALARSQREERAETLADIERQQAADDRIVEALTQHR
jgi:hypothetical protein